MQLRAHFSGRFNPLFLFILLFGLAVIVVFTVVVMTGEKPDGVGSARPVQAAGTTVTAESGKAVEEGDRTKVDLVTDKGKAEAAASTCALKGRVVDESGNPIAGAEIASARIRDLDEPLDPGMYRIAHTTSREGGRFELPDLAAGTYSLLATWNTMAGHTTAHAVSEKCFPRTSSREYLIVVRRSGEIAGTVVDGTDRPVSGALVVPRGVEPLAVRSDDAGRFMLKGLPVDLYTLSVHAKDFAPAVEPEVATGFSNIHIRLGPGGTLSGTVFLDDRPHAGTRVVARGSGMLSFLVFAVRSAEDGTYRFDGLPSGQFNVTVDSEAYAAPAREGLMLAEGGVQRNINFTLTETGGVKGRVVDAKSGRPLEGTWVNAHPAYASRSGFQQRRLQTSARTDGEGRFRLPHLAPTAYRLAASGPDDHIASAWKGGEIVEIVPGETRVGIEFRLENGTPLLVKIRSENGEPIGQAQMELYEDTRNPGSGSIRMYQVEELQEAGAYLFHGLKPGRFIVNVTCYGWNRRIQWVNLTRENLLAPVELILEPARTVNGKVVSTVGGGVANALVRFDSGSVTVTRNDGTFTINNLNNDPDRRPYVTVMAEGYLRLGKEILFQIIGGGEITLSLEPLNATRFVAGTVKNDAGDPVSGLKISARQEREGSRLQKSGTTKEDGSFRIEGLVDMPVQLNPDTTLGKPKPMSMNVNTGRKDLTFVVHRFAIVKGRVLDVTGAPVPDFLAQVEEKGDAGGITQTPESFREGLFELDRVPPGNVTLLAVAPDGREARVEVERLRPGEVREGVILTFAEPGAVAGKVIDRTTGEPVAGAKIFAGADVEEESFKNRSLKDQEPQGISLEDGTFSISHIMPGKVNVKAVHPEYRETLLEGVVVEEGETVTGLVLPLEKGGSISGVGRVDDVPKAGIRIKVYRKREKKEAVTGEDGSYRVENLGPGQHSLYADFNDGRGKIRRIEKELMLERGQHLNFDIDFVPGGSLVGTVYLRGEPKGDIHVKVWALEESAAGDQNGSAQTKADGSYEITDLSPGRYGIRAQFREKLDSYFRQGEVEVSLGVTRFDLHIDEAGRGRISGCVFRNGAPLKEALVSCLSEGVGKIAETDERGEYAFSGLPAGAIRLAVLTEGIALGSSHLKRVVELAAGESVELDFHYRVGTGGIKGRITRNGEVVDSLSINLNIEPAGGEDPYQLYVQCINGDYIVSGLPTGMCAVSISDAWMPRRTVEIIDGKTANVDIAYETGDATIEGTLNRSSGASGVYLFASGNCPWTVGGTFTQPDFGGGFLTNAFVEENGLFRIKELPARAFDVVGVRYELDIVVQLDVKRVVLRDGETEQVSLDVGDR